MNQFFPDQSALNMLKHLKKDVEYFELRLLLTCPILAFFICPYVSDKIVEEDGWPVNPHSEAYWLVIVSFAFENHLVTEKIPQELTLVQLHLINAIWHKLWPS